MYTRKKLTTKQRTLVENINIKFVVQLEVKIHSDSESIANAYSVNGTIETRKRIGSARLRARKGSEKPYSMLLVKRDINIKTGC